MVGYANIIYEKYPTTHHFSYRVIFGWRIDFGEPGGFVLEPSIGYFGLLGKNNFTYSGWRMLGRNMLFVRGPVFSIALGCRF
jgi:hypothetical protein